MNEKKPQKPLPPQPNKQKEVPLKKHEIRESYIPRPPQKPQQSIPTKPVQPSPPPAKKKD